MGGSLEVEEIFEFGDKAAAVNLLSSGLAINCRMRGKTPLYLAIQRDRTETAELLLARGAHPRQGSVDETPLHCVAVTGNADIASKLLEREVDVNARNKEDVTPLWLAAGKGHYDIVHLLLQHPHTYVDGCHRDALKKTTKSSPLCQAVCGQYLDICKELLAHRASVDLDDDKGCTPLHHACRVGNAAIVSELIQHRCSLDCVDKRGRTPLHTAVNHNYSSIVDMLIQAGCDVNLACSGDWDFTPLHIAVKRSYVAIVSSLCSVLSIKLDSEDRYSMTPMILACKHGTAPCFQQLLSSGADADCLAGVGLRPLPMAVCLEEDPVIQWHLQQHEAEERGSGSLTLPRDEDDTRYASSTHQSLENIVWSVVRTLGTGQQTDHVDVLHALLKAGADVRVKDKFHNTATEYSMSLYSFPSVLLLLCHGATISENLLSSFLAWSCLKAEHVIHGFVFPVTVALIWASATYRHLLCSYYNKWPYYKYYQLPEPIKTALFAPMTLAQSCRSVVRDLLIQNTSCSIVPLVEQLPVPRAVRQFLLLSDVLLMLACNQRRVRSNEEVN